MAKESTKERNMNFWIQRLNMEKHPEGGYFVRSYAGTDIHVQVSKYHDIWHSLVPLNVLQQVPRN